jgi:photosystem II stability/assembly factor-like uncharacterized protein
MVTLCGLAALALAGSCKTRGGGSSSGGGGGGSSSSWLVGVTGTMIRLNHKDLKDVGEYELSVQPDLYSIACRGDLEAWVAGSSGTILRTTDGGASWQMVPTGRTVALRSVAVAQAGGVYVAGDDGSILITADAGKRWRALARGTTSFTAVATTAAGDVALLTGADGSLWRYQADGDRLAAVVDGGPALHSVAITPDGQRAVAVGERGLYLVSGDGGRTFRTLPAGTTRSLFGVWLLDSGERAVAVGEAGVIVDITAEAAPRIVELLGDSRALRALHLSADGDGLAVGDRGAAFISRDAGHTWTAVDVETTATLHGVDALHAEPHL